MGRVNQEMENIRDLTAARDRATAHERGLNAMSKEQIDKIKTFEYTDLILAGKKTDLVCSICLLDVKERAPITQATGSNDFRNRGKLCELQCGHIFHASCVLDGWLTKQQQHICPNCREDLRNKK